jgi:hypothetical protein
MACWPGTPRVARAPAFAVLRRGTSQPWAGLSNSFRIGFGANVSPLKRQFQFRAKLRRRDHHKSLAAKDTGAVQDHRENAGPAICRDVQDHLARDAHLTIHL